MIVIRTTRLNMRELVLSDHSDMFKLLGDDQVMRYSISGALTEQQTYEILKKLCALYKDEPMATYAITKKDDAEFIGVAGLLPLENGDHKYQITYWLFQQYQRLGYATEAVQALVTHATTIGIDTLVAYIKYENSASVRCCKKAGMIFNGPAIHKGIAVQQYIYNSQINTHTEKRRQQMKTSMQTVVEK